MIVLCNGMQYMHWRGYVYADSTSRVSSATFFNVADKSQIVWEHYAHRHLCPWESR